MTDTHLRGDAVDAVAQTLPLVAYECGCYGFAPDETGRAVVLSCCDNSDDNDLGFGLRNMADKTYRPLSDERKLTIFRELQRLVGEGYRFRELKALLA